MLIVETIAKIRGAYFVHQKSIKAIYRQLKASRPQQTIGGHATLK